MQASRSEGIAPFTGLEPTSSISCFASWPSAAVTPGRRRRIDQVVLVDGTLIPTSDHRLADTRLVIATGYPQPGNGNDCTVYRTSGIDQKLADAATRATST